MLEQTLIGFVHNPRQHEASVLVDDLIKSNKLQDLSWVSSATDLNVTNEILSQTSTIITVGGDGTILRVVRLAAPHEIPILAVNMGRVGFMTELTVDEVLKEIPSYLNGNPRVEERMMLHMTLESDLSDKETLEVHALNDVVLGRGLFPKLLDIDVSISGVPLATYRSDGVIVATSSGSTGYALAAGGLVMHPELKGVLVQPLAAHIGFQAGVITTEDSIVTMRLIGDQEAVISIDGLTHTNIGSHNKVTIVRSQYVARFLRLGESAVFYSTLKNRLGY